MTPRNSAQCSLFAQPEKDVSTGFSQLRWIRKFAQLSRICLFQIAVSFSDFHFVNNKAVAKSIPGQKFLVLQDAMFLNPVQPTRPGLWIGLGSCNPLCEMVQVFLLFSTSAVKHFVCRRITGNTAKPNRSVTSVSMRDREISVHISASSFPWNHCRSGRCGAVRETCQRCWRFSVGGLQNICSAKSGGW